MKFSTFFLSLLISLSSFADNSECDLNFDYSNTGSNMTFFFTPSAVSNLHTDGVIGAFYINNNGAYICASSMNFSGSQTQLPVMADDTTTPEKDGFQPGETIYWFFKSSDGSMHSLNTNSSDGFLTNAISIIDALEVNNMECGEENENDSCQNLDYSYTNTGTNMTFALPNSSVSSISSLGNGIIGVFYTNNQGTLVCAGSTELYGSETAFPIMGDDQTTPEVDGLLNNQELVILFTAQEGDQYKLIPHPTQGFLVNDLYYVDQFETELYCSTSDDVYGCMNEDANNFNPEATIGDNSCTYDVLGCTDEAANNFNNQATVEDESCTYDISGCTDSGSCNYNPEAVNDDGSCIYVSSPFSYEIAVSPASWSAAITDNYNSGILLIDESNDLGCHEFDFNFEGAIALIQRGECQFSLKALNAQNAGASAVIIYNNIYGGISMAAGSYADEIHIPVYSMDGSSGEELSSWLENSNNSYTTNLQAHTLTIATAAFDCEGNCVNDADQDGICDEDEIEGCLEAAACNFNPEATEENNSCTFAQANYDCTGNCLNDTDQDGICDEDEEENDNCLNLDYNYTNTGSNMTLALPNSSIESILDLGAGSLGAFYYNSQDVLICAGSTSLDGLETAFPIMGNDETTDQVDGYLNNQNLNLIFTALDGSQYELTPTPNENFVTNGIYYVTSFAYELILCGDEILGCTDQDANNYNSLANTDDESCTYDVFGCTDQDANNYNSLANTDDESCTYDVFGCTDQDANNYNSLANTDDESCTYDEGECGCTDASFVEYYTQGFNAECDNGTCEVPVQSNGITSDHFNTPLNTAINSTIGFDLSAMYVPEGTVVGAFYDLNNDGQIGGNAVLSSMNEIYYECVGLSDYENSFFTLAIWGDDPFSDDLDGVPSGSEDVLFAFLLPNQSVVAFDLSPETFTFASNGLLALSSVNLEVTVFGCTDPTACNFNSFAEEEDGSCEGTYGCMEEMYVDYNAEAACHSEDLCADTWHDHLVDMEITHADVLATLDSTLSANNDLEYALENQIEFSAALENEILSLTTNLEFANATIANLTMQLTDNDATINELLLLNEELTQANNSLNNLLDQANTLIDSMEVGMGTMQAEMNTTLAELASAQENENELSEMVSDMTDQMVNANETIGQMTQSMESLNASNLEMQAGMVLLENTNQEMTIANQSLQIQIINTEETVMTMTSQMETVVAENEALSAPIEIDLTSGWNIIGYALRNPQDVVISFETVEGNLSVVKNNSGQVYWPEFGYNGIGDLLPGLGYQVLVFENHQDFFFEDMGGLRTNISPTVPQWAIDMEVAVHPNDIRTLVRVVNTLGQEVQVENEFKGSLLYYLYNDGSVEKKVK